MGGDSFLGTNLIQMTKKDHYRTKIIVLKVSSRKILGSWVLGGWKSILGVSWVGRSNPRIPPTMDSVWGTAEVPGDRRGDRLLPRRGHHIVGGQGARAALCVSPFSG